MSFDRSDEVWNELGEVDPFWAVLSDPAKRGGKWDPGEFFLSGRREIDEALISAKRIHPALYTGVALDFGCGLGRLTQPLATHFREVHGVDAAASMIAAARQYDQPGGVCNFHVNPRDDLKIFPDNKFDFIYSRIVLQHIPPEATKRYLAEFLRVLKPGGLLMFQLPSERFDPIRHDHPCRARITTGAHAARFSPGEKRSIPVCVTNTSNMSWRAFDAQGAGCFRVGNHWLLREGRVVTMDDGRVALPLDVKPGENIDVVLEVMAPAKDGDYLLEIDVVREGYYWFKDYGVTTSTKKVHVGPWSLSLVRRLVKKIKNLRRYFRNTPAPGDVQPVAGPTFDMNAIHKDEVLEVLRTAGGQVLAVQDDASAGASWLSYMYFVSLR